MNFEDSRENIMIRDAIRDFVQKECSRDVVSELDEKDGFPQKLVRKMAKLGFMGITVPEEFEGEGKNIQGACFVAEEIAAVYPALAGCFAASAFYGGLIISELGSPEQKKSWLPRFAGGKAMCSLLLDGANENSKSRVLFRRDVEGFVLEGDVEFASLGDTADLFILAARESDTGKKSVFLLDAKNPDIQKLSVEKMGLKGLGFSNIAFNRARVDETSVLGGVQRVEKGDGDLEKIKDMELLFLASSALGMAKGARDYAMKYAKQRVQFDQPIGKFPAIGRRFSELSCMIDAAELSVRRAAWMAEKNMDCTREVAVARELAGEVSVKAAMQGMQVLGGYGYTMEYDIQRYVRDSVAFRAEGSGGDDLKRRIMDFK